MAWWVWVLIGIGAYLIVGILVSVMLYYTPYRDNGAIIITLLWPLFVLGIIFG